MNSGPRIPRRFVRTRILGDFSGEFLVDIDVLHFVSLLSFLPYSDKIEGGRGKAPGSPLLICGAEWRS